MFFRQCRHLLKQKKDKKDNDNIEHVTRKRRRQIIKSRSTNAKMIKLNRKMKYERKKIVKMKKRIKKRRRTKMNKNGNEVDV